MVSGHVTKAATEKSQKFPFVTVDLFEVVGHQARLISGVDQIIWSPIVDIEEFDEWTNYSTEQIKWYNESIALYLAENATSLTVDKYDHSDTDYSISSPIPGMPIGAGPWKPIWQVSPPPNASYVINFDMNAYGTKQIDDAVDGLRMGLMTEVLATPGQENVPPRGAVVEPVFGSLFHEDTAEIVGHIYSLFPWDAYLVNLLPEGVSGITAILKNSCNQSFTYTLNGTSVCILISIAVSKW